VGPGDAGYDDLRAVFNSRIDRRPAAIATCRTAAEVAGVMDAARELGLPAAVRAGGMSDHGTIDGGVLLDLASMDDVEVDAGAKTAAAGGGARWAAFDAATQAHGLAATGGRVSRLGVAGVALGEGSGWLERALGPAAQSLVQAEVVLAEGRIVRANAGEHPELLAALREGAGQGCGVVTRLWFDLQPLGPVVTCGFLTYPRERAAVVARAARDVFAQAPHTVGGGLTLYAGRGGACTVTFIHTGSVEEGEHAVAPLRGLRPTLDAVRPNEYRAFQAMTDLQHPWGMRALRRAGRLSGLPDATIDAVLSAVDTPAATLSRLTLSPLAGDEGAGWAFECLGLWPPVPALDAGSFAWVTGVERALAPRMVSAGTN
jgi:FAD/FMN-containing dehydrogenase